MVESHQPEGQSENGPRPSRERTRSLWDDPINRVYAKVVLVSAAVICLLGLPHNSQQASPKGKEQKFPALGPQVPGENNRNVAPVSTASSPSPQQNPYYNEQGIVVIGSSTTVDQSSDILGPLLERCELMESQLVRARLNLIYSRVHNPKLENNPRASTYAQAWSLILAERDRFLQDALQTLIAQTYPEKQQQDQLLLAIRIPRIPQGMDTMRRVDMLNVSARTCRVGLALCRLLSRDGQEDRYATALQVLESRLCEVNTQLLADTAQMMPYRPPEDPTAHMSY